MAADDLEATLLGFVLACHLPAEEPIMRWWANPDVTSLRLRAHDHALLLAGGLVEYHVESDTGAVQVLDHRDPRSMRSQRYEPGRPQPYMPPSIEEDWLPRRSG